MFGEQIATTVFYGTQALLATAPPSRPGGVNVTLMMPQGGTNAYASQSRQLYTYKETDPRMMEFALRQLHQSLTEGRVPLQQFSTQMASKYLQANVAQAGIQGHGYEGGNMLAYRPAAATRAEHMHSPINQTLLNEVDDKLERRRQAHDLKLRKALVEFEQATAEYKESLRAARRGSQVASAA